MLKALPSISYSLIIRPNGIDAPFEIIESNEHDLVGFFDTYKQALSYAVELAKRSGFAVAYASGIDQPEKVLFDFQV